MLLYLIPRGAMRAEAPPTGGPIHPWFTAFLVLVTGTLLLNGLLIVANSSLPRRAGRGSSTRSTRALPGAWFLGWSVWAGTMAFALDWDEIRGGIQLFLVNGVALLVTIVVFRDGFLPDRGTPYGYIAALLGLTIVGAGFYVLHERRRPAAIPDLGRSPSSEARRRSPRGSPRR